MDTLKNIIYAGVGLASTTSEKIKETIDELVEKGKISEKFDFLNKDKELDSLKARIKELEGQIAKMKKKPSTTTKKSTKSTTKK